MKTMLPVLFFTMFCMPLFSYAGPKPPILEFSADQQVGCHSLTSAFSDDTFTSGPYTIVSYTWDFGDGTIITGPDGYPTHTYSSPGLYNVTMTVVSLNGWTNSVTMNAFIKVGDDFTVNLGPDTTICGSNIFTIDATTPGGTYLWNQGSTTPTIKDSTTDQFSVVVNKYGCEAKDTINITRNLISVDLGPDQDLCDGGTLTLSGGNAGADILWNTGDITPDITIWDGGEYSVIVSKDGCSAYDTVNITWKPELSLNFGFAKVGGCLPVDMKFTDSSTACTGSVIGWAWDFGDGGTSTLQNPVHTFTTKGQFPVRLTVTASSGSTLSKTKKVIIDPAAVSVNLGADTIICFGESLVLDAANPGAAYSWNTGAGSQQITVSDDGAYSVSVNIDGCTATDTINVSTTVSATSNFGYSVGGNCLPVTVSFSDSSTARCGKTITGWKWTFGDGTTSAQRNPVHVYNTADSFNVKLTVTASGGSTSTRTKKVVVTNTPFSLDLPAELKVCRGGSVGLDAVVTGAQYSWAPTFGLTASNVRNPTLTPALSGWYAVAVTKCNTTVTDSVMITMDSVPKPLVMQEGNSLKAPDATTYQWYYEGKIMAGAAAKNIRVDKAGYYSVRITNSNNCVSESDAFFFIPVSGDEKAGVNGYRMKISPNPAKGRFNILLSDVPSKAAKVSIYDAAGKRLLVTSIQDHVNLIDATKFLKGLYFVEIIINTDRTIMPVVIQ